MANLFGGSTKTKTEEKSDTGPSSFQRPYLDQSFGAAKDIYASSKDTPYYGGSTYAGMSPEAKDALAKLRGYASGAAMDAAGGISAIGSAMVGNAGKAGAAADSFSALAGEDPTQANLRTAEAYANDPNLQGVIDANTRDIGRSLREETLPGIDRAASGTGNINSSRTGIAAGIAMRGAADRVGDVSASIRSDAYNRGLDRAQSDRAARLSALGQSAGLYGDLTRTGIDAWTTGTNAAYGALDRVQGTYALDQVDRQGSLEEAFKRWQGNDTRASDLLARYNAIVGSNAWGQSGTSSGTSTAKQSGNIFGQLSGAAATVASFMPSDPRLKTDVVKIGEDPDGLGWYEFNYVPADWLPTGRQRGVMADEVQALRPHALGEPVNGFLTVRYDLL